MEENSTHNHMKLIKDITDGIKGFFMGAANVVPGVSGGTVALISGIYNELIDSLNALMSVGTWKSLFKDGWKKWWETIHGEFLLSLGVGVILSIFTLAKVMGYALDYHPIQTWAFFFGLIVASAAVMLSDIKGWKWSDAAVTVAGMVLGLAVCTLSPSQTPDDMWFIAICGAIAICTMILPGISGSFILVILGKYDYIMGAIDSLNIPVLAVFGIGCMLGIMAFSKALHWLLERWERQTMLVLVGFVIGSLVKVWPWNDMDALAKAQLLRANSAALINSGAADAASQMTDCSGAVPVDLQIPSAIIFALIGVALIAAIEIYAKRNK